MLSKSQKRTDKVLGFLAAATLAYEAYTLFNGDRGDTESESIWRFMSSRPLAPFALGMLIGHFVWQSQDIYEEIRKDASR